MRNVRIFSTITNNTIVIESAAQTLGELTAENSIIAEYLQGNVKAMVRETKNTLDNPEASLPEGEFTLFITPMNMKAGISANNYDNDNESIKLMLEDMTNELEEYIYNKLSVIRDEVLAVKAAVVEVPPTASIDADLSEAAILRAEALALAGVVENTSTSSTRESW
jgi:hypothetical protein